MNLRDIAGSALSHTAGTPRSEVAAKANDAALSQKAMDSVSLSAASTKAKVELPHEPMTERLAGLKSMIAAGTYHIPAMDVASKMVTSSWLN